MPWPEPFARLLNELPPLTLAFSGGLDSRFLAHAAQSLGRAPRLFHIAGPHVPGAESAYAAAWAEKRGLELVVLRLDPLAIPEVRQNGTKRCYYCKLGLFTALLDSLDREKHAPAPTTSRTPPPPPAPVVCDGSNASDLTAYRPGRRALAELGIRSPLAEAGLDKNAIRALALASGLDWPDQQARPCLLTRFAYDLSPDEASLRALDAAEAELARVLRASATPAGQEPPDFRLRLVGRNTSGASGPGCWLPELHLAALPDAHTRALLGAAVTAAGFAAPALVETKAVSGHFDRDN